MRSLMNPESPPGPAMFLCRSIRLTDKAQEIHARFLWKLTFTRRGSSNG